VSELQDIVSFHSLSSLEVGSDILNKGLLTEEIGKKDSRIDKRKDRIKKREREVALDDKE